MEQLKDGVTAWWYRNRPVAPIIGGGVLMAAAWAVQAGASLFVGAGESSAAGSAHHWLMAAAAAAAGFPIVGEAWNRLRVKQLSIPLLVTVAAAGALIIGEAWEAAAVTFLYSFGNYLEGRTLARTRQAVAGLVASAPRTARVLREGKMEVIPAAAVTPGETVVVLPGDAVPVDGIVTGGRASLDTSSLTGEPLPVETGPGDEVLGGSVSQRGQLEVEARRVGADTTFSRLIHLVTEAQEQKPRVQRFLDRFARWYTPAVIVAAAAVYAFSRDPRLALTILVIGCPGALVVAAPVATVAGIGRAARQGVLIKGGERLERIGTVNTVAFDKTGTLTEGRPKVVSVTAFGTSGASGTPGKAELTVLALAAGAEERSEHHLASAIMERAREAGARPVPAKNWSLEPGLGVIAETDEGTVIVGNRRLLAHKGITLDARAEAAAAAREARGETIALVALNSEPIGVIGIADEVRPEAAPMIAALKKAGIRRIVMLTGDHRAAAERVAGQLGIDEVRAGLLPEQKVEHIEGLRREGQVVAMVGDGINDAPALAAADVSIAMGRSGTRAAIETADIALMNDRLSLIPGAMGLSKRIMTVIRQNVVFATSVVLLLVAGVLGRVIFIGSGMLIHVGSVLLVIANGMRLLSPERVIGCSGRP